jgi:hypothetical protein
MLMENFYTEFCKLLGIVKKTLQQYIHELKKLKLLFVGRKRNKAYNYEINLRRSTVLQKKDSVDREKEYRTRNVESLINNNFRNIVDTDSSKAVRDIATMTETKRAENITDFIAVMMKAIGKSIQIQKNEGKERPKINAALVNTCITDLIDEMLLNGEAI